MIGSDYSAHRRSIDELEQDYESQRKKAKEREEARNAKIERNVSAVVKRKDAEMETAIRDVKDKYQSTLANQTKADKLEREQLKQKIYDRTGRQAAAVNSALSERDRVMESVNEAEKRYDRAISDSENYYERRAESQAEQAARERDELVENYRKQIAEARSTEEKKSESAGDYREKLRKESESAIRQAREEVMSERRQAQKLADQYETTLKSRDKKSDHLLNTRLEEKNISVQEELHKNAEANRQSREIELQPLREQLTESAELNRKAKAERNEARSGAIRELEQDWNAKYMNQSLSHDLEKGKLRADTADAERAYSDRLNAFMRDNNQKTAQIVTRQNADHSDQMAHASQEYNRSLNQVKTQAEHEKDRSEALRSRERARADDRQSQLLDQQAATYQTTIERQRMAQQGQIKNLERVLNDKNTTADAGEISAAAEQTVRNAVSNQYEKTFQAEAERNRRGRDHIQESYEEKLRAVRMDKQSTAANLNRQNQKEQSILKSTFVQHIADVEENKRQMLNLSSDANLRMTDEMTRNNARSTNEMRRHYEELDAERSMESSNRIQEILNQAEFERRAMRREFQSQTSDLVRNYEKKLSDQKVSYEESLRDMKAKLDSQTRDSDRRMKQVLAEQARAYDHRLAETEAQAKDREKLLMRNHEEELDKVKKSNALLLSKKG